MTTEPDNLATARCYLQAIEAGATGDDLASFYTPDAVQEEFPNRLNPRGRRRGLDGILEGAQRGQQLLSGQRYEVLRALASGDSVALEVLWVATLAIAIADLPAGFEMRAHFAMFIDFRDGKIAAQRNYDCFDPW